MKRKIPILIAIVFAFVLGLALVACDTTSEEKRSYAVKFVSDGKTYDVATVQEGSSITNPTEPAKNGYTFGGWFLDENIWQNPVDSDSTVTQDTTVYAKWTPVVYSITYNFDGGALTEGTTNPVEYTIESEDITLSSPVREGYAFNGWQLGNNRMQTIAKGSVGNLSFTATWVKGGYTITYENTKGADNTNPLAYAISDNAVALKDLSKTGYTFDGWYKGAEKVTEIAANTTGDLSLTAKWKPVVYSITYNFEGGALTEGTTNPAEYTIESDDITLASPVRKGYAFDGWQLGNNRIQTIAKGSVGNLAFTAKWVKDGYTITYENTKGADNTNPFAYSISDNAVALKDLSKTGYTFDGWYKGAEKVTEIAANTTGNITLEAKWKPVVYSITYNFDGGALTEGTTNPAEYTIESDDITLSSPVRKGYAFDGWQLGNNRMQTIAKGSVGNLAFTAKWVKDGYTITYENTKGADNTNPFAYSISDNAVALKDLSKTGYTFDGWYKGAEKVTEIAANTTGNITLEAKWKPVVYSITYNFDGGALTEGTTNPAEYTIESDDITLSSPVRKGYAFDGWQLGNNRIQTIAKGSVGNLSFTATWVKGGYTITYENTKGADNTNPFAYSISDNAVALKDLSKTGYTFDGWYKGAEKVTEIAANTTGNITLEAKWTLTTYTITYKGPNDEVLNIEGFGLPESYTVESAVVELGGYYIAGYRFEKWMDEQGRTITFVPYGTTGNLVLNGIFAQDTTFAIHYIDERFGKTNDANPTTYEIGEVIDDLQPLKKFDYDFKGWSTGMETVTVLDTSMGGDIYLYATWEQKKEFKGLDYVLDEQKNVCILLDVEDKTVTNLEISDVFTGIKPGALAGVDNLEELSVPFLGFDCETTQSANLAYLFGHESNAAAGGAIPSSLTKVTVKGGAIGDYAFANLGNVKEIVLSPDITEIGFYAFYKCSQLVELTMPAFRFGSDALVNALKAKGATFISGSESMAMYYGIVNSKDSDLKDANAPLINLHINGAGDVSKDWNAQGMFYSCNGIGTVTVDNLKVIHKSMFSTCEKLTQVTIGNSVEEIQSYAFQYCKSLTEIVIPDSVTKLGISYTNEDGTWHAGQLSGAVFRSCHALSKAVIGNGVEIIPRGTFQATALEELTIGENVRYIDFSAFYKISENRAKGKTLTVINNSKYKEWVVSGPVEASVMDAVMASDNAPEKIYFGFRSFETYYYNMSGNNIKLETTYEYFLNTVYANGFDQYGTAEQITRWKLVFYSPTDPYAEGGAASKDNNADIEYWYHDDGKKWYLEKCCVTPKMWEKPQT